MQIRPPRATGPVLALLAGILVFSVVSLLLLWELERGPIRSARFHDLGPFSALGKALAFGLLSPAAVLGLVTTTWIALGRLGSWRTMATRIAGPVAGIAVAWATYAIATVTMYYASAFIVLLGLVRGLGGAVVLGIADFSFSLLVPVAAGLAATRGLSRGLCPVVVQWFLGMAIFAVAYLAYLG